MGIPHDVIEGTLQENPILDEMTPEIDLAALRAKTRSLILRNQATRIPIRNSFANAASLELEDAPESLSPKYRSQTREERIRTLSLTHPTIEMARRMSRRRARLDRRVSTFASVAYVFLLLFVGQVVFNGAYPMVRDWAGLNTKASTVQKQGRLQAPELTSPEVSTAAVDSADKTMQLASATPVVQETRSFISSRRR
jgi:hypothetical protein